MLRSLSLIAAIVFTISIAFSFTSGWLTPNRLTAAKLVASLAPPAGAALGHRRNHAKGICFTGTFTADGSGSLLSTASILMPGQYPVIGRFNIGSPDITVNEASARVRGMGLQITGPEGSIWRMALINLPFFPVATPAAFYELEIASASRQSGAIQRFTDSHPEFAAFRAWAARAPWTASYADERYNSLDSFVFTDAAGTRRVVRWSFVPTAPPVEVLPEYLRQLDANYLESDIVQRVQTSPTTWILIVAVANDDDPVADPSEAWLGTRRTVRAGELTIHHVQAEPDGPCRSINFDPVVLPTGIDTSDDPFPAARSSAYRRSYDLRTAEARFYPRSASDNSR